MSARFRFSAVLTLVAMSAALISAIGASPAAADEAGPDTFGYTATDSNGAGGPVYTPIDIAATGTDLGLTGDNVDVGPLPIAPFDFYGTTYTDIRVGADGIVGFGATDVAPDLSNDCGLPAVPSTGDGARIYPLHDDLDMGSAQIQRFESSPVPNYYVPGVNEPDDGATVIQFTDAEHWPSSDAWDMWVILHDDGDITIQVGTGNPENGSGSTTGIQNGTYTDGLHVQCNTGGSIPDNYVAHFEHPDSPYPTTGGAIAVTTLDDTVAADGKISLREAVSIANKRTGADTIVLASGSTYTLSRCASAPGGEPNNVDGDLDHTDTASLAIDGNGATITTTCLERLITANGPLSVTDTVLTGGRSATGGFAGGGAILGGGPLSISGSTFRDNASSDVAGGAILAFAPVAITDSSFEDNTSTAAGGALASFGPVNISTSSFTGNSVTASTFGGGGVAVSGNVPILVTNSTFSGNTADIGAAIADPAGAVSLVHTSILHNTSTNAAAGDVVAGTMATTASVVALSDGAGTGCAVAGAVGSNGYNFGGDNTCGFTTGTDTQGTTAAPIDPKVGPLVFSSPGVHVPVEGSPLRDAIPAASCTVAADQRGVARPTDGGCEIGAAEAIPAQLDDAGRFVPLPPARLFDTRPTAPPGPKGKVGANGTIDVQVTGVGGVPADAIAVVMNVTATEASGEGFVTAWPTGSPRPNASNLNMTVANQTRPNLVTVPIGAGGKVSIYTQAGAHLLADVAGYYIDQDTAVSAGRVVTVTPFRVFDTRPTAPPGPKGKVPANGKISVQVTGVGPVPTTGVSAVILNVTATEASAAGFVTAWPTGVARPNASILNLEGPGATAPNLVMVPVGTGGKIDLYSQSGAHLLADVTGYVTDDTAVASTDGLFVPLAPTRVFDTRTSTGGAGPKGIVAANAAIDTATAGAAGIPSDAAAAVLNVTATGSLGNGFVTAWPTGSARPNASTLNLVTGDTRPNAAILRVGAGGKISYYSQSGTHLLADTAGYYLG